MKNGRRAEREAKVDESEVNEGRIWDESEESSYK